MGAYSVNYDLRKPDHDYEPLIAAIQAYGTWCHPLKSFWIISTRLSAAQIRDDLWQHMHSNDGLEHHAFN